MYLSSSDLTNTLSFSRARLKAIITLAAVASLRVDTATVLTDARLGTALVQVCQYTEQRIREETMKMINNPLLNVCNV